MPGGRSLSEQRIGDLVAYGGLALDDLAGSEIAVVLRLKQGVFINGFAEVSVVVRGDVRIVSMTQTPPYQKDLFMR